MRNKQILNVIADNPSLFEEVKLTILEHFEKEEIRSDMSDEILGQITRSKLNGIKNVQNAFNEIARYKTPETPRRRELPR